MRAQLLTGSQQLWFFSGHMALGQRLHVQAVGKRDKRWHTQKPDMQGGHEHKDLGMGKGWGLWDSIWTLTPGWRSELGLSARGQRQRPATPASAWTVGVKLWDLF